MQNTRKKRNVIKTIIALFLVILSVFSIFGMHDVSASTQATSDLKVDRLYEINVGTDNFALYVYVYNPEKKDIKDSTRNKISIGYTNNKNDILRLQYSKYTIELKDNRDYYALFKITGFEQPTDDVRFYAVSGIEILTDNNATASEYTVSAVYRCETIDDVNYISTDTLPTCTVDVTHTFYRTDYSSKNERKGYTLSGWSNQISSCYFSLPKNYSDMESEQGYGQLEALTAEFYNYYTQPVIITESEEDKLAYDALKGLPASNASSDLIFYGSAEPVPGSFFIDCDFLYGEEEFEAGLLNFDDYVAEYNIDTLKWVFHDDSGQDFNSRDFLFDGDNLKEYFYNYSNQTSREQAIEDLMLSASEYELMNLNLSDFNYGYNRHTYSIAQKPGVEDDIFGFGLQIAKNDFWRALFGAPNGEEIEILPLVMVDSADVRLSDEKFAKKYYIDKSEAFNLKRQVVEAEADGKDTWILRYDVCEYYGKVAPRLFNKTGNDIFLAMESVYLDFDVLSFRFVQDNEHYTIANVSNPDDVFNDITPAPQPKSWWQILLDWLSSLGLIALTIIIAFIAFWLFRKFINWALKFDNIYVKIILTLLILGALITAGYFGITYVIEIIDSIGVL